MARSVRVVGMNLVINELKQSLHDEINKLRDETYKAARDVTPVKTGNAKRNWKKRGANTNFKVENKVPYIERLEAGASRQAPNGIINPTLASITRRKR
jgi:hypothetical protein